MLFIYRKSDGIVLNTPYTNSVFPDGIPNHEEIIEEVISEFGGVESDYDVLRLHDVDGAETVNKTFTHEYTIQKGKIVFGAEKPIPETVPQPPSLEEQLAEQLAERDRQIIELKEKQTLTSEIVEINGLQQQELLELLIDMGVI